jgi:hypothetical protein
MFGQIMSRFGKLATTRPCGLEQAVIEQFGVIDSTTPNARGEGARTRHPAFITVRSRVLLGRRDSRRRGRSSDRRSSVTTLRAAVSAASAAALIGVPHWSQNRAPGSSSVPHDAQAVGSGVAHGAQNLAPSRFTWPQLAQFNRPPSVDQSRGQFSHRCRRGV